LIPAHNEELLVGRCVRSLLAQRYPQHLVRVVVVADNCTDATADVAVAAGAAVMVRDEPGARGKGHALRWAMDRMLAESTALDGIVVIDADSIAEPGLLAALAAELEGGHDVVQADYRLLDEPGPGHSEMVEVGFILFHRVRFTGRARLGMAANLVGNGMLFSRRALELAPWSAFTGAEDLEQSVQLRLAGFRPRFAPDALVAGPGPVSGSGAVRQRLRWEGGRFHVLRGQLIRLLRAVATRRDLHLLDAAIDLATPPLALVSLTSVTGAIVTTALALAGLVSWWAVTPWAIAVLAIPTFVCLGLWSAGASDRLWLVVLGAPRFISWKLVTYLRLLHGHDVNRWDRTDRAIP
jgi:1,2-diacylglycerol 3-beta-glucosyltransferase